MKNKVSKKALTIVLSVVCIVAFMPLISSGATLTDSKDLKKGTINAISSMYILNQYKAGNKPSTVYKGTALVAVAEYAANSSLYTVKSYYSGKLSAYTAVKFANLSAASTKSRDDGITARASILAGTYDFAKNPNKVLCLYTTSLNSIASDYSSFKTITNQSKLTKAKYNTIVGYASAVNVQKVLIYGKNSKGKLVAKYICLLANVSSTGSKISYMCINPENSKYMKKGTIGI